MNAWHVARTAAYYFLNDNRNALHIPLNQDFVVSDLYDNRKNDLRAQRLPRQIVVEYTWQEEVELKDDPAAGLEFGQFGGKKVHLYCGGTLVFDDRGNLLSWSRKHGIQHLSELEAEALRRRISAWQADPVRASAEKIKRPTKKELTAFADRMAGQQRLANLLTEFATKHRRGLIEVVDGASAGMPHTALKPVTAIEENGVIHFTNTPHLRNADLDTEEGEWLLNY